MKNLENLELYLQEKSNSPIYIVGAGSRGITVGRYALEKQLNWEGYIDEKNYSVKINGKKVYSYDEIPSIKNAIYIISSIKNSEEMRKRINGYGIEYDSIISISDEVYNEMFKIAYDNKIVKKITAKLEIFKNRYEGNRCIIIGNGPSLRIDDLNRLNQEFTFACNSIYRLYPNTSWRPTFYVAHDEQQEFEIIKNREDWNTLICSEVQYAFTSVQSASFFHRNEWCIENLFFYKRIPLIEDEVPFSSDPSQCVYSSGSVSYAMLQLAIYMGFRTIYMIGFDNTFAVEKKKDGKIVHKDVLTHHPLMEEEDRMFFDDSTKRKGLIWAVDSINYGFEVANQYANKVGAEIINLTRGGELNTFHRQSFDEIDWG